MKYITILLLTISLTGYAQEKTEKQLKKEQRQEEKQQRKEAKAAKRAEKAAANSAAINRVNELIEMKKWVLEGTSVTNKKGEQIMNLNSNLNFMYVDGEDNVVIQLNLANMPGWDGIPQMTVKGRATMYEIKVNGEGKPSSLRAAVISPSGSADIFLSIGPEYSIVTISGNGGSRINLTGVIKHPDDSLIYQGVTKLGN